MLYYFLSPPTPHPPLPVFSLCPLALGVFEETNNSLQIQNTINSKNISIVYLLAHVFVTGVFKMEKFDSYHLK